MRTITAQKEAQRQQQAQQQPPVSNTPQQTVLTNGAADPNKYLGASGENHEVMEQTVNEEDTKSIDLSSLNVQTLPQMINPALMERKMKLPNGAEIPAKQYIQEVVYPQLPKNGVVILDNGAVLPVKQFIEEGVMFECQEKYNGDFPKYMAERTRSNLGVVTVGNGDERYDLNPVEITEYINPALLDKRVKLPNGVEISARQYIQEVYAPHIPANGMVTLSNGAEIPVKQYIEEVLLWEGQEKNNGDIEQILYNTTRNNTGIVNADPKNLQEALIKIKEMKILPRNIIYHTQQICTVIIRQQPCNHFIYQQLQMEKQ